MSFIIKDMIALDWKRGITLSCLHFPFSSSTSLRGDPVWCRKMYGFGLLCAPMVFQYCSPYRKTFFWSGSFLDHWIIEVCGLLYHILSWIGLVQNNPLALHRKPGLEQREKIVVPLPSSICGHFEKYRVFKMWQNIVFDMSLGYHGNSLAPKDDWLRCKYPLYLYGFHTGGAGCMAVRVNTARKSQKDGAASLKRNRSPISEVFVQEELFGFLTSKRAGRRFLARCIQRFWRIPGGLSKGGYDYRYVHCRSTQWGQLQAGGLDMRPRLRHSRGYLSRLWSPLGSLVRLL